MDVYCSAFGKFVEYEYMLTRFSRYYNGLGAMCPLENATACRPVIGETCLLGKSTTLISSEKKMQIAFNHKSPAELIVLMCSSQPDVYSKSRARGLRMNPEYLARPSFYESIVGV